MAHLQNFPNMLSHTNPHLLVAQFRIYHFNLNSNLHRGKIATNWEPKSSSFIANTKLIRRSP